MKVMKNLILTFLLLLGTIGCGHGLRRLHLSKGKYKLNDYQVRKRSKRERPDWIERPQSYGQSSSPSKKSLYFSFETEPKIGREIACNLIKAYARDQMGDLISDYLLETVNADKEVRDYIKEELISFIQEGLKGAEIEDNYWEKRVYFERSESGESVKAFICAMLVEIDELKVKKLIDLSVQRVDQKFNLSAEKGLTPKNLGLKFLKMRKANF